MTPLTPLLAIVLLGTVGVGRADEFDAPVCQQAAETCEVDWWHYGHWKFWCQRYLARGTPVGPVPGSVACYSKAKARDRWAESPAIYDTIAMWARPMSDDRLRRLEWHWRQRRGDSTGERTRVPFNG